jgi:hypothetical protein
MGSPVRESDDRSSKTEPKSEPSKNASRDGGAAPPSRATTVPGAPWTRKPRHEAFEGDVAIVELRSRLARGAERVLEPKVQFSTAPVLPRVLWRISGVAMAAVMVGGAGYLWGFKLSTKMPELTPTSGQTNPALSTTVTSRPDSNGDFDLPAETRTVSIGRAPVVTRRADNPVISVPPQNISHAVAPRPFVAAEETSAIAAKMKMGVELMTWGEVAAARMMFQRAAEAGEGAGAFALAETYDPLVLAQLRLRKEVMPDLALARSWYERARDLGSPEARDRISRLAQLPQ